LIYLKKENRELLKNNIINTLEYYVFMGCLPLKGVLIREEEDTSNQKTMSSSV
jgi:hypothetical protein